RASATGSPRSNRPLPPDRPWAFFARRRREKASVGALFHDVQELHVEDESCSRLDSWRGAAVTIGEVGRTDEPALAPDLHELQGFGPAGDHLVEREGRGLAAVDGAIEDRPVGERAVVM